VVCTDQVRAEDGEGVPATVSSLAFSLAELWHVGCLTWRPGEGAAVHGWATPTAAAACCLSPGTEAADGWDWGTTEPLRVKSAGQSARSLLLLGVKHHGMGLGPAQTLFFHELGWDLTHYLTESP